LKRKGGEKSPLEKSSMGKKGTLVPCLEKKEQTFFKGERRGKSIRGKGKSEEEKGGRLGANIKKNTPKAWKIRATRGPVGQKANAIRRI